jgi:hypothetical protein
MKDGFVTAGVCEALIAILIVHFKVDVQLAEEVRWGMICHTK